MGGDMPCIAHIAVIDRVNISQWLLRNDCHTMIALLAVNGLVFITEITKKPGWELVVHAFDLLQTQDIGLMGKKKLFHQGRAQAHGIDVPGCYGKGHELLRLKSRQFGCSPRGIQAECIAAEDFQQMMDTA
jgi:hypothetical protein